MADTIHVYGCPMQIREPDYQCPVDGKDIPAEIEGEGGGPKLLVGHCPDENCQARITERVEEDA